MTLLTNEIRRRWSAHQDRLLLSATTHRVQCVATAWGQAEKLYERAYAELKAQEVKIREKLAEAFSDPLLSEDLTLRLRLHQDRLDLAMATVPSEIDLKLVREPVGEEIGEVLRRVARPQEKGPGEVLLRVDWSMRVRLTAQLEFQLGGAVERPLDGKQAVALSKPVDEDFERRVAAFKEWRVAAMHNPIGIARSDVESTWRFLVLPPSATAPQMLVRLDGLKAAAKACSVSRPSDQCGVITDDARHARIAKEHGYLAFVPPL